MPTNDFPSLAARRRFSLQAAWVAALIAAVGLAGFLCGSPAIASLGSTGIPIAPSTALCLLLLSASAILRWKIRPEAVRPVRRAAGAAVIIIAAASMAAQSSLDLRARPGASIPFWVLSPVTALLLIILAAGLYRIAGRRAGHRVDCLPCFLFPLLVASLFLGGYLFDAPLLYGGTVVPMAMPAAAALCAVAASFLAADEDALATAGLAGDSLHAVLLRNFLPLPFWGLLLAGLFFRVSRQVFINPALIHWGAFISLVFAGWFFILRAARGTQTTLQDIESKYRVLYRTSRDALVVAAPPDWRFTGGNPAAISLFGARDEAEFLSHGPVDLSPPAQPDGSSSPEKARDFIEKALREGSARFDWTHRRIDGTDFPTEVIITPVTLGGTVVLQGSIRDLSENAARDKEVARLSLIAEQSPALIVLTDLGGNIEYVNPRFSLVTGYAKEEILGKNPRILKGGEVSLEEYKKLWATISSGKEWRGVLHNKKKNGEMYWTSAVICPIKDAAGRITHFAGIQEDITQSRSLHEQLVQAQKMEAVGRLAGGVAHDFNNLLTVILGYCKLLYKDFEKTDPRLQDIQEIEGAAVRAAALTRQLLAFSRRQILAPRVIDLNAMVEGFRSMLARLIGEEIRLLFIPGAVPW